jgi:hypothetical protein
VPSYLPSYFQEHQPQDRASQPETKRDPPPRGVTGEGVGEAVESVGVGGGQGGIEGQGGREVSRSGAGGGGGYKWVRREGRVLVSRLRYSIYLLY